MLLAPALQQPPRQIAERLGEALSERLGERIDHVEVAGPGFLNIFLADGWYTTAAGEVLMAGDGDGGGRARPRGKGPGGGVSGPPTRAAPPPPRGPPPPAGP